MNPILEKLIFIYGETRGNACYEKIEEKIQAFYAKPQRKRKEFFNEEDAILITYGDQFHKEGERPLQTIARFAEKYLKGNMNSIHFLPFFPYTSDDGFSVVDYYQIGEQFGKWEDLEAFEAFRLMFDFVCNHISAKSEWFQQYLAGNPAYANYFIEADPHADYHMVTRPRALPLLTKFETSQGEKHVWTTFSTDQIDLNFKNEDVLLECIDILLFYVEKGADLVRLDAVGYLWKELGTSCIHLPQTHAIIQLLKSLMDATAKEVVLVTETNVPHKDNIAYLGDGTNEAGMVYQFALPPLTLHTMLNEDATVLSQWASELEQISDSATYFNFLASHDGIGVNPARSILGDDGVDKLIETVQARGGLVSYKNNPDGTQSVYELNISYFNAVNAPSDDTDTKIKRFCAAYAIAFSLMGVPGVYIHSLIGSENDHAGVEQTGMNRSINREKLAFDALEEQLNDTVSQRHQVYQGLCQLLKVRQKESAFHPVAKQLVFTTKPQVLSFVRENEKTNEKIIVLQNVSKAQVSVEVDLADIHVSANVFEDVLTHKGYTSTNNRLCMTLSPFETLWLKAVK